MTAREKTRVLDGQAVSTINANLSTATDLTQARILPENQGIAFMGDTKVGPFEIPEALAREWLSLRNPNGKSNADVVRPVGQRPGGHPDAAEALDRGFPPGDVRDGGRAVRSPLRVHPNPRKALSARKRERARIGGATLEARPEMRRALTGLPRFLVTPRVSKHRVFAWVNGDVLPDCQLIVFARADDYFFGVLHSRPHEVWALAQGTQLREKESGFRYTPTTCFETFPFPQPTAAQEQAIAEAARALDVARGNWLGDRSDTKRTLTALYNQKPTWLLDAHAKLDVAVIAAYGWNPGIDNEGILRELLALNTSRSTHLSLTLA